MMYVKFPPFVIPVGLIGLAKCHKAIVNGDQAFGVTHYFAYDIILFMNSLKKRKGKFYGEFFLQFLEEERLVILCHTNEMHLDTILPVRKELDNIDYQLKFFKRKVILSFFDKFNKYSAIQQVLNGSLAIIFPRNLQNVNINIFDVLKNQKKILLLGLYLNNFYLVEKGQRIFDQFKNSNQTRLKTITQNVQGTSLQTVLKGLYNRVSSLSRAALLVGSMKTWLSSSVSRPNLF